MAILLIVDFPDKATFLNPEQREIVLSRIERDRRDSEHDALTLRKCIKYLCEPRIWLFGIFFGSSAVSVYALAYFLPVILASMGFDNKMSQVLVAPPNFWCIIPAVILAKLSDRYGWRGQLVAFNCVLIVVGTCMFSQLGNNHVAARYAGVFLATGGCQSNIPLITSWAQTTIRSQSKRAFTSAFVVAWGSIGGIIASVSFLEKEAKHGYPTGIFLTIGLNVFTCVCALLLVVWFKWQNRKADRGEVVLEGCEHFRYK